MFRLRPFGIFEIYKNEGIDYNNPIEYYIDFLRREKIWKYFIINTRETQDMNLSIQYGVLDDDETTPPPQPPDPYPANLGFELIDDSDWTPEERAIINTYKNKVYLFRSVQLIEGLNEELPLPYYEKTA